MYFYEPSPLIAFPYALCPMLYEGGELHLLRDLKIKIFLLQVKATLCNNKNLIAGF